jgi:cytochrome c biogenesis protein CcdA
MGQLRTGIRITTVLGGIFALSSSSPRYRHRRLVIVILGLVIVILGLVIVILGLEPRISRRAKVFKRRTRCPSWLILGSSPTMTFGGRE